MQVGEELVCVKGVRVMYCKVREETLECAALMERHSCLAQVHIRFGDNSYV